jgi:hypothetical protein
LRQVLLGLADLTLVEPKTDRPDLFARLDLDDPANGKSTEIRLSDRTGQAVAELIVGRRRTDRLGTGNDAVYVRKPGADRAWLARGSLDVSGEVVDWLDRRILDIPAARIASVKLTGEGATLVLSRSEQPTRSSKRLRPSPNRPARWPRSISPTSSPPPTSPCPTAASRPHHSPPSTG